ncbi:MAG TPA: phage holin family protein [Solirubrobacteraceae bacterium]|nr:phage holin family protein [Solirubrobacteraceae bacterium]
MTPVPRSAFDWEGQTVVDRDGEKIGKIEEIFLVEETGRPEWGLVKLGRIKGHATLVPLTRARVVGKGIEIPFGKDVVSDAPSIEPDEDPSEQQVNALYRHYRIPVPTASAGNGSQPSTSPQPSVTGQQSSSPPSQPTPPSGSRDLRDAPIGDVVQAVKEEASTLAGQEMKLAKAEMGEKVKDVGIGAGMAGGAGYVAYLASIAFMLCLIFALAEVMPEWAAALIVTVVLAIVAAVLALKAKKKIQQAGPPIPEQTVESVKQTVQTVKEGAKWGLGQKR